MEISHKSHIHPLLFIADGESEDDQDEPVFCWGCEDEICGPRFSCFTCSFHLHKSCTELPHRLVDHPLHPQHTLSLLTRHSYASNLYTCDACARGGNGFVYSCSQCDFDLHIICALPVNQEGSIVSKSAGENDYFRYGLYQHLLLLEEEQSASSETESVNCFVCLESISIPFFFCSRLRCKFQIHKFCANLPKQIKNSFLHPERSLFLVPKSCREHCEMCGQEGISSYVCVEPNLFIHPKCAYSNPKDTMKRVGKKQIQHRSHDHNLTFLADEKEWAWTGKEHSSCCLCMEQLASCLSYGCQLCPFIIHKSCAELPGQIKSHLHPKHPLILFATTQSRRKTNCGYCAIAVTKLNYRCLQCGFTLHADCFFSLHDSYSEHRYDHHHNFVEIKTFRKLACDACGEEDYFSPSQCTACYLMVHKKCAELSRSLRVDPHIHELQLTYYLSFIHKCDTLTCRLCYKEVNVDYAVYYCYPCNYVTHLSCAQKIGVVVLKKETEDDSNIAFLESASEGSHNSKAKSGTITLLQDCSKGGEIQHFTHQCGLTLNEQDSKDYKYCEGCVTLISSPFYSCEDCGFYLHKRCFEFPKTQKFSFHPHPLHLNLIEDCQFCFECVKIYNGFMYSCQFQDCLFKIDLHCVKLMEGLNHPCHEHQLFFPDPHIRSYEVCRGCGHNSHFILVCLECEYVLGYCCAKLPHSLKHRYDDHLLNLAFKEDEFGEYYCDICEYERDPEKLFYCCIQCDFFAHIDCALGDYPYVKFGTTFTLPLHDHPLTFVQQPTRKPLTLCFECGKGCYSRVLECRGCSFCIHFTPSCIGEIGDMLFKSLSSKYYG